jgi:Lon protease-like protein
MCEQTKILPFFPLGIFLFPGEDHPLRIFEPRYLQLINEARDEGITFAIPFVVDSESREYGCEVRLKEVVAESPKGQMVIVVESVNVVRINSMTRQMSGKLYAGGSVTVMNEAHPVTCQELVNLVIQYTEDFDTDFLKAFDSDHLTLEDILVALNLPSEEKFRYLKLTGTEQKEQFLIRQMKYLMLIRNQEQLLDNDFGKN